MIVRKATQPIQSLDRGPLSILEFIGQARRPVSVADLTPALEIDRSSVFRLANTLRLRGFLIQLPSKEYVLGPAVCRLAGSFRWSHGLIQIAREHVAALALTTGETTHLVIREGRQAVFVDHELTAQPVGVSVGNGRCEPLNCTAVGKALIADFDVRSLFRSHQSQTFPQLCDSQPNPLRPVGNEQASSSCRLRARWAK